MTHSTTQISLNVAPKGNNSFRLMNEDQVADMLGISPGTLRNQRYKKEGLPYVKIGSRVMYRLQDILDYIEQHLFLTSSEAKKSS